MNKLVGKIKNLKLVYKILSIILLVLLILISIYLTFKYENEYGITGMSDEGLILLDDYEGYNMLVSDIDSDGDACHAAYDLGDSVITFGLGVTFETEQLGIEHLNETYNTSYKVGDCIKVSDLLNLQREAIYDREQQVLDLDRIHRANLNQQQYDAVMMMFYLNEDTIRDQKFWKIIKDKKSNIDDYSEYFITEYSQFKQWEDYQYGWSNRILDSSEVFYNKDYTRDFVY